MKAAGLSLNLLEYWILVAVRLPDAQSGASTNYLHRTPGDGPLLGRPPFLKRYATGSSLSKKPASATHSPSRNCGPGNGILSGTASMGCTRRECSFIGKMTSRRCSRAQPLNTLLTEKASPLRQSANVIRASSAWARGGGRARARRDQLARPAPFRGMRCKVRRLVLTSLSVRAHRLAWDGDGWFLYASLTFGGLRAVHPASLSEQSEERRPDPNAQHLAGVNHAR
jgi:hypothetical protein